MEDIWGKRISASSIWWTLSSRQTILAPIMDVKNNNLLGYKCITCNFFLFPKTATMVVVVLL
jgi:hypothetical protein